MLAAMVQLIRQRADRAARAVEAAPPTLALGDLPPQVRRGVEEADEIRWTEHQSLSGVQRASGIIQIERNPDLSPYRARLRRGPRCLVGPPQPARDGRAAGPPDPRGVVHAAPARQPTLPDWASEVDEHLAAMQLELAQRVVPRLDQRSRAAPGRRGARPGGLRPACGFCALG